MVMREKPLRIFSDRSVKSCRFKLKEKQAIELKKEVIIVRVKAKLGMGNEEIKASFGCWPFV